MVLAEEIDDLFTMRVVMAKSHNLVKGSIVPFIPCIHVSTGDNKQLDDVSVAIETSPVKGSPAVVVLCGYVRSSLQQQTDTIGTTSAARIVQRSVRTERNSSLCFTTLKLATKRPRSASVSDRPG